MRTLFATTAALAANVAATLTFATGAALLPMAEAQAWWACPNGYDAEIALQSNNTRARCVRPEQTRALDECPNATANGVTIGTGLVPNYNGNPRDKCVGRVGGADVVVLNPTCNGGGSGYSVQVRTGTDRCRRGAAQAAPSRNV